MTCSSPPSGSQDPVQICTVVVVSSTAVAEASGDKDAPSTKNPRTNPPNKKGNMTIAKTLHKNKRTLPHISIYSEYLQELYPKSEEINDIFKSHYSPRQRRGSVLVLLWRRWRRRRRRRTIYIYLLF